MAEKMIEHGDVVEASNPISKKLEKTLRKSWDLSDHSTSKIG